MTDWRMGKCVIVSSEWENRAVAGKELPSCMSHMLT